MNESEGFGKHLTRLRRKRGLSQAEVGARLGASQATVSRLEVDASPPNDPRLLSKLANALNVTITELLADFALPPALSADSIQRFYAFCPNPLCDSNTTGRMDSDVFVNWKSTQLYPIASFALANFCERCGEALIKECPSCETPLEKPNTKYCVRCGTLITKRPTPDEWNKIRAKHPKKEVEDDDLPF